jgi:hypothetical protein
MWYGPYHNGRFAHIQSGASARQVDEPRDRLGERCPGCNAPRVSEDEEYLNHGSYCPYSK